MTKKQLDELQELASQAALGPVGNWIIGERRIPTVSPDVVLELIAEVKEQTEWKEIFMSEIEPTIKANENYQSLVRSLQAKNENLRKHVEDLKLRNTQALDGWDASVKENKILRIEIEKYQVLMESSTAQLAEARKIIEGVVLYWKEPKYQFQFEAAVYLEKYK